jgi:hypothetical protein
MNIFVIDSTQRPWENLDLTTVLPGALIQLVHCLDPNNLPEISSDDHVLCHTHARVSDNQDHPDFCLAGFDNMFLHSEVIKAFCENLSNLITNGGLPMIWLFTGGGIDPRAINAWEFKARTLIGLLPDVQANRIKFWCPISQTIPSDNLKSLIVALLERGAPTDPTPTLAFRLLCEAWKIKNIDKNAKCGDIEIHAPEGLEQWLAPFGKKPEDDKVIEQVAGMIGSDNIQKTKAEAVLKAANGDGKLEEAIPAFLKAVESDRS